ncbi:MAG: DUF6320 domain-containing protein [Ethanoligenens sp.]
MKYCEKCHISVRGEDIYCPLCRHRLTGIGEDAPYPSIPTVYQLHKRVFKRLGGLSAVAAAICVCINLLLPRSGSWSAFAVLGIACFWISLAYVLHKQRDVPKTVTGQVVVASLLCVLWDVFTGWHVWSIDYVFPILCMGAMVSLGVFTRILKMPVGDYFIYLFANIAFGVVPLLLLLAGLLRVTLPSQLCVLSSVVSFTFLIVTEGKMMRSEIERRLHF